MESEGLLHGIRCVQEDKEASKGKDLDHGSEVRHVVEIGRGVVFRLFTTQSRAYFGSKATLDGWLLAHFVKCE